MMMQFSDATTYGHYTISAATYLRPLPMLTHVVRPPNAKGDFYPFEFILGTLLHELCHNVIFFKRPLRLFCSPSATHAHTTQSLSGRTMTSLTRFYLSFLCQYISTWTMLCPTHLIYICILHATYMLSSCWMSL